MAINRRTRRRRLPQSRSWPGARSTPDSRDRGTRRRAAESDATPRAAVRPRAEDDHLSSTAFDAILATFTARWDRGEPARAEEYVGLLPPPAAAELIYHEYCLAEAAHLAPDPADYLRRFPDHSDFLARLFSLHSALSVGTLHRLVDPSGLPGVGDEIGPYRLLRELGRGAFARVFLAEQADLGDRLVVVKVSTRPSAEPTLLARARHAHIVEVLRHTEANDGELHLVCLPFLGGATLGAVLDARRAGRGGKNRPPRSGRVFLADLDRASAPEYPDSDSPRPAREIIARLSYPRALAWMVARLAGALDHAQVRGVTHGDIKPSNILITADGMPMLFDFNLAVDRLDADDPQGATELGGTLAYMAPERLQAIANPDRASLGSQAGRGRRGPDPHRADLYALGLVLLEALTGQAPTVVDRRSDDARSYASSLAELRAVEANPHPALRSRAIPAGLRAILTRCLAPDPGDRYARGVELAEDLDRWRAARPLAHAPEPARSTWARRARSLRFPLLALALTGTVALAVGVTALKVMEGTRRDQALAKWSYILDRTEGVFKTRKVGAWRSDSTDDPADLATRHLALYDVVRDPTWRDRDDIRALPDRERGEVEAWLLEQVLRRAVAYADRPNSPDDWRRGLLLLDREIARAPFSAFLQERAILRDRLGPAATEPADRTSAGSTPRQPEPWLDAYLLGVLAEPLHARQALGSYLDALTTRPDLFWGHYRAAVVACRIDEYPRAIQALRECVARRPDNAMLRNLLASTMYTLGRHAVPGSSLVSLADAQAECDRALTLNPDFAPANRTRTMINQLLGQAEGVRNDLDRFALLTRASNPAESVLLRMETRSAPGERFLPYTEADEATLRRAIAEDTRNERSKTWLADSLKLSGREAEAVDLYRAAIGDDPSHLAARLQMAIELARVGRPEGYLELAALVDHPRFEEIYRDRPDGFRAFVYLSRHLLEKGRVVDAEVMNRRGWAAIHLSSALRDEAVAARKQQGTSIHPRGEMHYSSAQVDIVAARLDPSRLLNAIAHLQEAFTISPVFRDERFPHDPFFDPDRNEILSRIDEQAGRHQAGR